MRNSLFAVLGSLAPVQGFLRRLGSAAFPVAQLGSASAGRSMESPVVPVAELGCAARVRTSVRTRNRANMPLRVVRVMEAGQAAVHGGRMMISGRMADVCAELDRMVERESLAHLGAQKA